MKVGWVGFLLRACHAPPPCTHVMFHIRFDAAVRPLHHRKRHFEEVSRCRVYHGWGAGVGASVGGCRYSIAHQARACSPTVPACCRRTGGGRRPASSRLALSSGTGSGSGSGSFGLRDGTTRPTRSTSGTEAAIAEDSTSNAVAASGAGAGAGAGAVDPAFPSPRVRTTRSQSVSALPRVVLAHRPALAPPERAASPSPRESDIGSPASEASPPPAPSSSPTAEAATPNTDTPSGEGASPPPPVSPKDSPDSTGSTHAERRRQWIASP